MSYIAGRLFDNVYASYFRPRHGPRNILQVDSYAHIPSGAFLYRLASGLVVQGTEGRVKLGDDGILLYRQLVGDLTNVRKGVESITRTRRKKEISSEEEDC